MSVPHIQKDAIRVRAEENLHSRQQAEATRVVVHVTLLATGTRAPQEKHVKQRVQAEVARAKLQAVAQVGAMAVGVADAQQG